MGHDKTPAGKDAADTPTDTSAEALPISDEAAEAAAGGGFWEAMEFSGMLQASAMLGGGSDVLRKLMEASGTKAAIPASSLVAPVQVACPVQLSGSISGRADKE